VPCGIPLFYAPHRQKKATFVRKFGIFVQQGFYSPINNKIKFLLVKNNTTQIAITLYLTQPYENFI
jgi:hypothetical protein